MPLNNTQRQEIAEVMAAFGWNNKEQQVYLALLQSGPVTLSPLSRAVQSPVTTVQSVLSKLVGFGVVTVTKRKTRRVYTAEDPTILKQLLERQLQDVKGIMPLLKQLQSGEASDAKIKIYYRERMADIFHQALEVQHGPIYEIVSARDLQDILGEKFHFTRRRTHRRIRLKSLRVEAHEIKKYSKQTHIRELREAKFLPQELTFTSNVLFWDNTVAFFTSHHEGLAWTVESPSLSEMWRQLFDMLWSVSRIMATKG